MSAKYLQYGCFLNDFRPSITFHIYPSLIKISIMQETDENLLKVVLWLKKIMIFGEYQYKKFLRSPVDGREHSAMLFSKTTLSLGLRRGECAFIDLAHCGRFLSAARCGRRETT